MYLHLWSIGNCRYKGNVPIHVCQEKTECLNRATGHKSHWSLFLDAEII